MKREFFSFPYRIEQPDLQTKHDSNLSAVAIQPHPQPLHVAARLACQACGRRRVLVQHRQREREREKGRGREEEREREREG